MPGVDAARSVPWWGGVAGATLHAASEAAALEAGTGIDPWLLAIGFAAALERVVGRK
jgi:hypothetical protein